MINRFKDDYDMPDPSCVLKFNWSTIRLYEQTTNSCHRVHSDHISIDDFDDFHNTPLKLLTRQQMLDGNWPNRGCEYCQKIEEVGGVSERMQENSHMEPSPILLKNNRAVRVTPTIVEVYFSNVCNMACLYCNAYNSTIWENENRKFNLVPQAEIDKYDKNKQEYPAILKKYWEWLEKNVSSIKEYRILGGEPFFQVEFEQNIKFFEERPCPNLSITVFSNFKVKNEKFRKILNKIQSLIDNHHLKSFRLVSSIDAWGPQEEYVRHGLNLIEWEENFKTVATEFPNIKLSVVTTLCNLNIKTCVGLFKKISEFNIHRITNNLPLIEVSTGLVSTPDYLRPNIFPNGFFDEDFEQMIKFSPTEYSKEQLPGYRDVINKEPYSPELIKKLKLKLDQNDERRNLNWKLVFPWLDELIL